MVREAKRDDLDALLELYLHLHEKSIPAHDETLEKTWDHIMTDENYHLIVNETDCGIVASCTCIVIPNLTRNVRPYALVENVVTHPDHRKKGYASDCLSFAKKIADSKNCYKIMLITGSSDPATHRFYENNGYSSEGKTAFNRRMNMDR